MAEISYEEALAGGSSEISYEDALVAGPVSKKKPDRGGEMSYEQAAAHSEATFGSAITTGFTGGVRQAVGGTMEAVGDAVTAPVPSITDAVIDSQRDGFNPVRGVAAGLQTAGRKVQEFISPQTPEAYQFGKDLSGAGVALGDEARMDVAAATPDDLNMVQKAGVSIATSTGQMLPWVAAARAGIPRGAVTPGFITAGALGQFGAQSFGQTYNEARAKGTAPEDAFEAALVSGAAEIAGEKLGLDSLLKMGSGWFKKFVAQEIGGEEFTTVVQSLVEKGKYNPEKWSSPDEVMYDLALTAMAAAGGAGLMGGANKALDKIVGMRSEQAFENSGAKKELEEIFVKAEAGLLDVETAKVAAPVQPTAVESVEADLLRTQIKGGLQVDVTPEDAAVWQDVTQKMDENRTAGRTAAPVADEGGVTPYVEAGRERRYEPSELAPGKRPIMAAAVAGALDEQMTGLTLEQIGDAPLGSVIAVQGANESVFPPEVYSRITADLSTWIAKYMPEARIVLNLEQFAPEHQVSAFGLYQMGRTKSGFVHIITPRDLPGFKYQGGDYKTAVAMLTALSHEFGHAVKMQTLFQNVTQTSGGVIANALLDQVQAGAVTPEVLSALQATNPEAAGMIGTWNQARADVLAGKMTAQEFMDTWAGIRKLGSDNYKTQAKNKGMYTWAKERLSAVNKTVESSTAQELILAPFGKESTSAEAQEFLNDYLSLDEYMAEQFSRAAYASGDLERSQTGGLFHNALAKLRQLFKDLKGERIIAPGTTFQAWLDAQTKRAKASGIKAGKFELTPAIKKARAKLAREQAKKAAAEAEAETAEEPVPEEPEEQNDIPPDVKGTSLPTKERLEELALQMEANGSFYGHPKGERIALAGLRSRIARGQFVEAQDMIEEYLGKNVQWDRDYSSKVLERLPNKPKILAETLRSYMKMQDIKQQERAVWEEFLAAHPEGFTLEEAKQAVVDRVLPLEPSDTAQYARYGLEAVGLSNLGEDAVSTIWHGPVDLGTDNHFNEPNYVMHSRSVETTEGRFITEMQSDYFQKENQARNASESELEEEIEDLTRKADLARDLWIELEKAPEGAFKDILDANALSVIYDIRPTTTPEQFLEFMQTNADARHSLYFLREEFNLKITEKKMLLAKKQKGEKTVEEIMDTQRKTWWQRLIREEMASAFAAGYPWLHFATADTVAKIEGWPTVADNTEFYSHNLPKWQAKLAALPSFVDMTGTDIAEAAYLEGKIKEAQNYLAVPNRPLMEEPEHQGIYDRYKREIAKFLRTEFQAEEVTYRGNTWLKANTRIYGEKVLNWDRDNPYNPNRPKTTVAAVAGAQANEVAQAQAMWERLGEKSPFFLRWLGDAPLVKAWIGSDPARGDTIWASDSPLHGAGSISREEPRPAAPQVQEYYVRLEAPLVKDDDWQAFSQARMDEYLEEAIASGSDGLVVRHVNGVGAETLYAVLSPEQLKATADVRKLDETDSLHWDLDSTGQVAARNTSKMMQLFWKRNKLRGSNLAAKLTDYMIQLQQVASSQPDDMALSLFMKLVSMSGQMKNELQIDAEQLVKKMKHSSPKLITKFHEILQAEEKAETLSATLVGKDENGVVVWGGDAPVDAAARAKVVNWGVVDGIRLRQFLTKQGINVESEEGQKVLHLYLDTRNIILKQFKGLEISLRHKAKAMYETAPTVLKQEEWRIEEMLQKFRNMPFLPKGNFGDHILIVQKDMGPQPRGKRRFQTVRRQHFESEVDFQIAYDEWQRTARGDQTIRVSSQKMEKMEGIPLQMPREFLESMGQSGIFTDDQLELMAEGMVVSKYEKLEARYERIGAKVAGTNDDFMRVFADFSLRNSNFIWKMFYQTSFRSAIAIARSRIREIEKGSGTTAETQRTDLERQRRNMGLMERSLAYMLHPPQEFQTARLWITMAYLAYSVKTAAMNVSTQMHTWAALSSEYGEINGIKQAAQGYKDALTLFRIDSAIAKANPEEAKRLNEIKAVYDKAIRSGVLDQSFAYYLAGQATSSIGLRALHNGWPGRISHAAMEYGMMPFKAVEKGNRVSSFLSFYNAERAAGSDMNTAYDVAVQKTGLLQLDYSAANKPELLRGPKSLAFMFASYGISMSWIMSGGYERGARASAAARGRTVAGVWHGTTMKLWLIYLMLGGLMGLPFAENILDLAQAIYRKLFGGTKNLELEMREMVGGLTGDSNVAMHGLLYDVGGFNLSGSFGLGRLFPGTDLLNRNWNNPAEALGQGLMKMSGPGGGFFSAVTGALFSFLAGDARGGAKKLPGAMGAAAKAFDATLAQAANPTHGVTMKDGTRLTWDEEAGEFRDLTVKELMGMALGFQPTIIAHNRDVNYTIVGETIYWQTRRGALLDKYWKAVDTHDEDLRAEVKTAVADYNKDLPDRQLRISGKDLATTVKNRRKANRAAENFGTNSGKRYRGISGDVRESFGETPRR